ncbi:MAG TPA: 3'(2'),5'-bisphosphate nucleotidase CysQ [Steroidobacteraceae bacterium]|nr:3'(2'),5'-bisphosphate nucleotidase CysQ [Steroidobacteraceae bacterium]
MTAPLAQLLPAVTQIARRAGGEILEVYASAEVHATAKEDNSPLTAADLRSHRLIEDALEALTPGLPVLSEESAATAYAERQRWARYWLVDPLDGTKEFLSRNGQFTVNIALIDGHAPVLGVVHVPVTDTTYQGLPGSGAWRSRGAAAATAIKVNRRSADPVRVVGSRSHRGDSLDAFLNKVGAHELVPVGSSLKFCMVAEGAADVYPRLGPTSEWDTAAAHAVVAGAGGEVRTLEGTPLRYNTGESLLNPFFVVYGPADRDWLGLLR